MMFSFLVLHDFPRYLLFIDWAFQSLLPCSWSDAVLWNPYLQMEACYKDFVCVENAKVLRYSLWFKVISQASWKLDWSSWFLVLGLPVMVQLLNCLANHSVPKNYVKWILQNFLCYLAKVWCADWLLCYFSRWEKCVVYYFFFFCNKLIVFFSWPLQIGNIQVQPEQSWTAKQHLSIGWRVVTSYILFFL